MNQDMHEKKPVEGRSKGRMLHTKGRGSAKAQGGNTQLKEQKWGWSLEGEGGVVDDLGRGGQGLDHAKACRPQLDFRFLP